MSDSTSASKAPSGTLQFPGTATMSVPTMTPQKLNLTTSSNTSATGNPRNKCALKPGFSLMNWIRLCNSNADLSGTAGRVVAVSSEELARHNKANDAWMAIRGKVFNVTRYMEFHPGGVEELMRGVGRDATKLFDEVHAWVNYPQLLGKCYVGPLKYAVKVDNDLRRTLLQSQTQLDKPTASIAELIPRFDWIQQRKELTLYLYTRQFANPGLLLKQKTCQTLELRVQLAHNWHVYDFELTGAVQWPPKAARIGAETGKIEVTLSKQEAVPWSTYGTHTLRKLDALKAQEERYDFEVLERTDFNHDSFELSLQSVRQHIVLLPPVGYHVAIEIHKDAEALERSYTPVPVTLLQNNSASNASTVGFLIKHYAHGQLSRQLHELAAGDIIQLSLPRGNFQLKNLAAHRNILLLAAGSGLTPMLALLESLLKRNTNRIERLHLLCFNKTQNDIWLGNALSTLQNSDARLTHEHLFSQAAEQKPQRISRELLETLLRPKSANSFSYIVICGPSAFNTAALDILKELHFKPEQMHVFQG